ncbi:MAG: hypothetical protein R3B99_29680 [Polyangiales bacterium]
MVELAEAKRQALDEIEKWIGLFVRGDIGVAEFLLSYRSMFALFDPPDLSVSGLSVSDRQRLDAFVRLMGGWFGECDHLIPRRDGWVYGVDSEPYGWVDEGLYRGWILEELARVGVER